MSQQEKSSHLSRREVLVGAVALGAGSLSALSSAQASLPDSPVVVSADTMVMRSHHTATLVDDTWMLVAGGVVEGRIIGGAVLQNLSTGESRVTAPMSSARARHAAVALPNGCIVVLGGFNGRALAAVEMYDPYRDVWTSLPPLACPRADFAAVLVRSGVMLLGGNGPNTPTGDALYPLDLRSMTA